MDKLTIPEYNLLMDAVSLREVDKDYRNHLQAFLNFSVKAEKKTGKRKSRPVYTTFSKFYNYEKEIRKILDKKKPAKRLSGLGKLLKGKE